MQKFLMCFIFFSSIFWAFPCGPRYPLYLLLCCAPQKDAASIANAVT
jgi:hypothetical protein